MLINSQCLWKRTGQEQKRKDWKATWGSHDGSVGHVQALTWQIIWSKLNCITWKVNQQRYKNFPQNNQTNAVTHLYLLQWTPLCKTVKKFNVNSLNISNETVWTSLHEECCETSSDNTEYMCLKCYKDLHGKKPKLHAQTVAIGL